MLAFSDRKVYNANADYGSLRFVVCSLEFEQGVVEEVYLPVRHHLPKV
jgi:hypothetical protein